MLNKEPVYQQLISVLLEVIREGDFRPGDKFLTERSICEKFGVSRATANKALSSLVSRGILEFRKGVGTFLTGASEKSPWWEIDLPGETLRVTEKGSSTEYIRIKKTGGLPVVLEIDDVDKSSAYPREKGKIAESIEAVNAGDEEARWLKIGKGEAVLSLVVVYRGEEDKILRRRKFFFRTGFVKILSGQGGLALEVISPRD